MNKNINHVVERLSSNSNFLEIWSCFIHKLYFFSFLTETCRNAEEYKPFAEISQLIQPANKKIALLPSVACRTISRKVSWNTANIWFYMCSKFSLTRQKSSRETRRPLTAKNDFPGRLQQRLILARGLNSSQSHTIWKAKFNTYMALWVPALFTEYFMIYAHGISTISCIS